MIAATSTPAAVTQMEAIRKALTGGSYGGAGPRGDAVEDELRCTAVRVQWRHRRRPGRRLRWRAAGTGTVAA
ncbi:hypothetical protein GCM10022419_012170 [Nonomuraea rosea]|uniref:Uncharacterized protein n=1 Tax=Nonomuraea rosea TaxID=638574 RepID=A0ABP6VEH6_9ACTN